MSKILKITLGIIILILLIFFFFQNSFTKKTSENIKSTIAQNFDNINPLSIETLRKENYPGSDIVIEATLEPGSNYKRYIASYKSEGLKIYGLLTIPISVIPRDGFPAIIFNHGYIPPKLYNTTERYVAYVDAITREGYIVFKPDYRGNGNSQ